MQVMSDDPGFSIHYRKLHNIHIRGVWGSSNQIMKHESEASSAE